jgi:hypothetical protein
MDRSETKVRTLSRVRTGLRVEKCGSTWVEAKIKSSTRVEGRKNIRFDWCRTGLNANTTKNEIHSNKNFRNHNPTQKENTFLFLFFFSHFYLAFGK